MFKSQAHFTNSMFGNYAYADIIKRYDDHLLVRLNEQINWSFVENETKTLYSENGRPAINPVCLFKMLVIQKLYNLSERDLVETVDCNIIYRYFVGLGLNENVVHFTEAGKFKERLGVETFEKLFYGLLSQAESLGIEISKKRHSDSSDIKACVDLKRCAKDKQNKNDKTFIDRNTSDKQASFGKKESSGKSWYGYKSHINQDPNSELVTSVIATPANKTDESQLIPLIDKELKYRGKKAIRQQGGDKGYVGHTLELNDRQIKDYIIPRNNMKKDREKKEKNNHYICLRKQRYKVEQKFAEAKKRHGLSKTKFKGKLKVYLDQLITYMTINLKRIAHLLIPKKT